MGSAISEINCPKCGFGQAMRDYYYKSGEEFVICYQCGYLSELFIDEEKTKCADKIAWKHEVTGGRGCYSYKSKEASASCIGPVVKGTIDALKSQLDKLVVCKYTFKRKGKWFIKDLLDKKTEHFSYDLILSD